MADRWVSVDHGTLQFPDAVRAVQAANLEDSSTVEGAAVRGLVEVAAGAAGRGLPGALGLLHASLARHSVAPVRIVTAGSSTMTGSTASIWPYGTQGLLRDRLQAAYPSGNYVEPNLVALDAVYSAPPTELGVHIIARSVGGTTSANYLDATARTRIAAVAPAAVFHMVGSNDWYEGKDPATYKAEVLAQITAIDALLSAPCVHILVHAHPRRDVVSPMFEWEAYGEALREIAQGDPDTRLFIDASQPFTASGLPGADPLGLVQADNIHLTDAGFEVLLDAMTAALAIRANPREPWRVVDTARRPDGAIGAADSGQAWAPVSGTWTVSGQKIVTSTTGTTNLIDARLRNVDVSAWVTLGSGTTAGVVACAIDDSNRFGLFAAEGTDNVTLFKTVAGTTTSVGAVSLTLVAGSRVLLRIVVRGEKVTGYVDGVVVAQYTMSAGEVTAFATATKVGVRSSGAPAGVGFDNFAARDVR
jgi:lysophospholipase L1-like esterase